MADKIVFSTDLDTTRGLAADTKAFVKVDGLSVGFDATGSLKTLGSVVVTPSVAPTEHLVGTITVNGTPTALYETNTSVVAVPANKKFTHTNESGVATDITAAGLLSSTAGNSLIVDPTDSGLYFAAQALIADDQVLTGDNTGTVTVTLTPTVVPDPLNAGTNQTNYVVKADTKVAPAVPSARTNLVKISATVGDGVYVDPADVEAGLALSFFVNTATPAVELKTAAGAVLASIPLTLVQSLDGTINRGWISL